MFIIKEKVRGKVCANVYLVLTVKAWILRTVLI